MNGSRPSGSPRARALAVRARLARRIARRRVLLGIESLEARRLLAQVSWTGKGDGSTWQDANNWSGAAVPGSADDVTIRVGSSLTVQYSGGISTIGSLALGNTLDVNAGALTVAAGNSSGNGVVVVDPGATLAVSGGGTAFSAGGAATIDGANLLAGGGASLSLPGATSYTGSSGTTQFLATGTSGPNGTGTPSSINLPGVTSLTNGTAYGTRLAIGATAGGTLDLSGVVRITDPLAGDTRQRSIDVTADAGTVKLDALTTMTDAFGDGTGAVDGRWSTLAVHNGGIITAPVLSTLVGVDLLYDGSGTLPTSSLTAVIQGRITASGVAEILPNLADAEGSSLFVSGGGKLSLPALCSYNEGSVVSPQVVTLQATGAGSVLDLGNVQALTNGTLYGSLLQIQALSGGTVDLHGAVRMDDLPSGDTRQRAIDVTADAGTVKLDALTAMTDAFGDGPGAVDGRWSTLAVHNGGIITAPVLSTLVGVDLLYDGSGTLPLGSLRSVTDGRVTASGVSVALPLLADADGSSLFATGGGKLSLPALRGYNEGSVVSPQVVTLQATGAGSVLDLGGLQSITNGTLYGSLLEIQALSGGTVDLHNALRIVDPSSGDTRQRSIDVTADAGTIKLDALTTMTDAFGDGSGAVDGRWSTLAVHNGGIITAPVLSTLVGVDLLYDGSGTLPLGSLRSVTDGRVTASGVGVALPLLADADGSSLFATGGGKLSLPALRGYNEGSVVSPQVVTLQATGAGSVLDLGGLQSITNGTLYGSLLQIQALSGGTVDLHNALRIVDPSSGDTRQRAIDVTADAGTIKLDALTTMIDAYGNAGGAVDGRWSTLVVHNGGIITAPNLTTIQGVGVAIDGTGTIPTAQIRSFHGGGLTISDPGHDFSGLVDASMSQIVVTGVAVTFPNLTRIDNASFSTSGGGHLSVPSARSYNQGSTANFQTTLFHADGAGSLLDLVRSPRSRTGRSTAQG